MRKSDGGLEEFDIEKIKLVLGTHFRRMPRIHELERHQDHQQQRTEHRGKRLRRGDNARGTLERSYGTPWYGTVSATSQKPICGAGRLRPEPGSGRRRNDATVAPRPACSYQKKSRMLPGPGGIAALCSFVSDTASLIPRKTPLAPNSTAVAGNNKCVTGMQRFTFCSCCVFLATESSRESLSKL